MSVVDSRRDTHLLVNTGGHWVAFVRKDINDSWRLHDNGRVYVVPDVLVAICVKMHNTTRSICGPYSVNVQSRHSHCTGIVQSIYGPCTVITMNVNRVHSQY